MEQLTDLKKKILTLLENHKVLKEECEALKKERQSLKESNVKLENLLLKEHGTVDGLTKEKDAIKVAIEHLIESIDKLAAAKQ
jgi:chromosome segregation ATPase